MRCKAWQSANNELWCGSSYRVIFQSDHLHKGLLLDYDCINTQARCLQGCTATGGGNLSCLLMQKNAKLLVTCMHVFAVFLQSKQASRKHTQAGLPCSEIVERVCFKISRWASNTRRQKSAAFSPLLMPLW